MHVNKTVIKLTVFVSFYELTTNIEVTQLPEDLAMM